MSPQDKMGLAILGGVSVALIALGFWIRRKENARRSWPKANGVIVASSIQLKPTIQNREEVFPVIEYEFVHEGQRIRTAHWRLGNYTEGYRYSANTVVERYPVGAKVTVFVNLHDPDKSVLETSNSTLSWIPFGFGFFLLALTILVALAITHQK